MPVEIDFSGASAGAEVVERGVYDAQGYSMQYVAESKQSGKPYIVARYQVLGYNVPPLYKNYSLQPQSLWNFKMDMTRLGFQIPDGPMDIEPIMEEFRGTPCRLLVEQSPATAIRRPWSTGLGTCCRRPPKVHPGDDGCRLRPRSHYWVRRCRDGHTSRGRS